MPLGSRVVPSVCKVPAFLTREHVAERSEQLLWPTQHGTLSIVGSALVVRWPRARGGAT